MKVLEEFEQLHLQVYLVLLMKVMKIWDFHYNRDQELKMKMMLGLLLLNYDILELFEDLKVGLM